MTEKPKEQKTFKIYSKISGNLLMVVSIAVDPSLKGIRREISLDQSILNVLEIKEEE